MRIKKVLNSSVVLAEDEHENEFILLGKGIGYGQKPGNHVEKNDEDQVYLPVDNARSNQILELLKSLPQEMIELTQKIINDAQQIVHCQFNSNLLFVLADHLNFAIERFNNKMVITNRVFWEIKNFYPKEFEAGLHSIALVKEHLNIELPEQEAANIAFHFANAQASDNPEYDTLRYAKLIGEIINLVRYSLNREFDKESIHYLRFVTHIKFFVERFFTDRLLHNEDNTLFEQLNQTCPNEMIIAKKIRNYLYEKYQKDLPDEELTFLVIHINRMERSRQN